MYTVQEPPINFSQHLQRWRSIRSCALPSQCGGGHFDVALLLAVHLPCRVTQGTTPHTQPSAGTFTCLAGCGGRHLLWPDTAALSLWHLTYHFHLATHPDYSVVIIIVHPPLEARRSDVLLIGNARSALVFYGNFLYLYITIGY